MTQEQQVLQHLKKHGTIRPLEALRRYGIYRLADSCFKLRSKGHRVKTRIIRKGKKQFAEYSL